MEFISSEITTTSIWSIIQEKAKIYFTCYVLRNITLYKGIDTAVGCDLFQTTPAQPEKPPTASHRYTTSYKPNPTKRTELTLRELLL